MNKKRIVFFSYSLEIGGMEKALINLVNSLCEYYDITLYLLEKKGTLINQLDHRINLKEYKISNHKIVCIRKFINFSKRIIWSINYHNKYDFSCNYATYSIPCSMLSLIASKNSTLYVHSNYSGVFKNNYEQIISFFTKLKIEKFRKVIFVSNESKDSLNIHFPNIESITIGNIIDYEKIIKLSNEPCDFNKNKFTKNLLFVGRLEEESKNIMKLLKIMKYIKSNNLDYHLTIIGNGKDLDKYKKFVLENNLNSSIDFLGEKTNPYPFMKSVDYIILTSNYEGFPVVFNEALVLSKPIISTIIVSDESINISNYCIKLSGNYKNMANQIINENYQNKINIDFSVINKKRVELISRIIEGEM